MKKVQRKKMDADKAAAEKLSTQSNCESAGCSSTDEHDDKPKSTSENREDVRSVNGGPAATTNGGDDSRSQKDDTDLDESERETDQVDEQTDVGKVGAKNGKTAKKTMGKALKRKSNDESDLDADDEAVLSPKKPKKSKSPIKNKKTAPVVPPEEEYEVKDIVGHKIQRGVSYYLIRWKGYTAADDTWEPEDTLSCPALIEKFKRNPSASASSPNGKGQQSAAAAKKSPAQTLAKKGGNSSNNKKNSVDPNKEWEVEKIIDYAVEKGNRVFRIRWKGFGPKHDTWEPEKNLNCGEIIKKFMDRMETLKNVSVKELREEPKKVKRLVNETTRNFQSASGRKSKRSVAKQRIYYGDSD